MDPSETIFIDAREKNVNGAKALGIHAIHYMNRNQALNAIHEYISFE